MNIAMVGMTTPCTLITRALNCWLYVERPLDPEYVEKTKIVDKLLESWESGEQETPKELFDETQPPMTIHIVDEKGFRCGNSGMSLYEFCALALNKPFDEIPKPLPLCCNQYGCPVLNANAVII